MLFIFFLPRWFFTFAVLHYVPTPPPHISDGVLDAENPTVQPSFYTLGCLRIVRKCSAEQCRRLSKRRISSMKNILFTDFNFARFDISNCTCFRDFFPPLSYVPSNGFAYNARSVSRRYCDPVVVLPACVVETERQALSDRLRSPCTGAAVIN